MHQPLVIPHRASANDIRILLLEDRESDRVLIIRELKVLGLESVHWASTREQLVEGMASFRPSIVLADYNLGSFTAEDALRLVRDNDPDLPFILVTGTLDEGVAAELLRAGVDDYLLKDRLARLGPAIKHALLLRELREKQQKANEDLRKSEERYRLLAEQLVERETLLRRIFDTEPECVKLLDADGRLLEMNRAGLDMLQVGSIDEIRNRSVYSFVSPEYRSQFQESVRRVFHGESVQTEFEMRGALGARLWMESSAVPLRDSADRITCLLAITRDMTKAKAMEEQYRQSQKLEAVGRLAGGVAHDFNNILTIIGGYTTMTLEIPELKDRVQKNLTAIQNSVTRASALTKQLLAFSRKQISQPRVLNLNTLIAGLSTLVTRLIGEDIRFTLNLEPDIGNINADPTQIEQVVMNLAINARDAMPNGGLLTIATSNAELSEPLEQHGFRCEPGQYVRLSVTDNGTGMSTEILSHAFEPFFTTKGPGKGTGLGLSMVYGIVQQSRGGISVASSPRKGTRFDVLFPITTEQLHSVSTVEKTSTLGSERILVVEDDQQLRELVKEMLTRLGYRVTLAESGMAALRLLDSDWNFDLILADIVMPGISGLELGRQINSRGLGITILYMSGYTEDFMGEGGRPAIPAGIHTIEKPFTAEALASAIRRIFSTVPGRWTRRVR